MPKLTRTDLLILAQERDIVRLVLELLFRLEETDAKVDRVSGQVFDLATFERLSMSLISDALAAAKLSQDALGAKVTALAQQQADSDAKIDALIVLAQRNGASQEDIDAALALKATADQTAAAVDAVAADITAEDQKIDQANPPA